MRCRRPLGIGTSLAIALIACGDGDAREARDDAASGQHHAIPDAGNLPLPVSDAGATFDAYIVDAEAVDVGAPWRPAEGVTISPSTHDFGRLVVGGTSAGVKLGVVNGGTGTGVFVVAVRGDDGAFTIDARSCARALTPGASCEVAISATPYAARTHRATLELLSRGAVVASATLEIEGVPPAFAAQPAMVEFPMTLVGETSSAVAVAFTNTSEAAAGPLRTELSDAFSFRKQSDGCNGQTIAPSQTCVVTLAFMPSAHATSVDAKLSLLQGAVLIVDVPIKGRATPAARLVASGNVLLHTQIGMQASDMIWVRNSGELPTGPLQVTLTSATSAFALVPAGDCVDAVLAPSQTCTIPVRFAPTTSSAQGSVSVTASPGGSVTIPLNGYVVPAATTTGAAR